MNAVRRFLCRRGLHLWSRPRVTQYATHRIVARECWFCETSRSVMQDVWSEPSRSITIEWADDVREHARTHKGGGAA